MRGAVAPIIAVLLVVAAPAHADRKSAERYFRAGEQAYKAQNFDAAAQNFDRAYEAFPAPEIAFSAAQAHRKQFRVETEQAAAIAHAKQAVALYRVYLAKVTKGGRVGDAIDNLAEMLRELDRLGVKENAAPNAVAVAPAPAARKTMLGVTVVFADQTTSSALREIDDQEADAQRVTTLIDGKPVTPDELVEVEPGEHVVRAEADGYIPVERKTKVVKDQEDFENLELKPKPARVTVETEAGGRIIVDGRLHGIAPAQPIELTAGTHVVAISRRGRQPYARELAVSRGETKTLAAPLEPTVRRRIVPWVFGAAAGLGVLSIAGTVPWLYYENRAEDLDAQLEQGNQPAHVAEDYNSAINARDTVQSGMLVTGAAALAVAGVGLALYYFDTPSTEAARVTPVIAPGGGGAVISGRF
jgi:hypothetical protein